mgnify:FL=1|jgi:hypothetical protein
MKLKDKVVEALKEDAESDSGFLSGFSKLNLCFNDSFVTINGETEVGHVRYSQIANVMLETLNLNPDDEYEEPELLNSPAPPKQEKPETAMGFLEQLSNLSNQGEELLERFAEKEGSETSEDAKNLRRLLIGATSQLVVFGMVICIKERSAEK